MRRSPATERRQPCRDELLRLLSGRVVALDFESAGSAPGLTDEPVQIAWAEMSAGEIRPGTFFVSYLRASRPVTWAAQRVHGIADSDLQAAPRLIDLWPRLRDGLSGAALAAHGAGTERRFLRAFPFHGLGPWIDTLSLARRLFPEMTDHSLGEVLEALSLRQRVDELCPGLCWHHALYDSVACLVLLRSLMPAR